jgi:hypothetical protein
MTRTESVEVTSDAVIVRTGGATVCVNLAGAPTANLVTVNRDDTPGPTERILRTPRPPS